MKYFSLPYMITSDIGILLLRAVGGRETRDLLNDDRPDIHAYNINLNFIFKYQTIDI